MPALKKADLVKELKQLGEEPPARWTMLDLQIRLQELRLNPGMAEETSTLKEKIEEAKKAWRKNKAALQLMARDNHVELPGTETKDQLLNKITKAVYVQVPATGQDPVGFGMHATKTYAHVGQEFPEYLVWCQQQALEGQADHRLSRLVEWWTSMDTQGGSTKKGYPMTSGTENGVQSTYGKVPARNSKTASSAGSSAAASFSLISSGASQHAAGTSSSEKPQEMTDVINVEDQILEAEQQLADLRRQAGSGKASRT